jgi:hypothetical protein
VVELFGPNGASSRLALTPAPPHDELYTASGSTRILTGRLPLDAGARYELRYTQRPAESTEPFPEWASISFETERSPSVGAPEPPQGEMGFWCSGSEPGSISSCSSERANEFTIIFIRAPGALVVHARVRYSDDSDWHGDRLLFMPAPDRGGVFTFWASDRGLPCVELVSEAPNGLRSAPTVICDAVGCRQSSGEESGLSSSLESWQALGASTCSAVCGLTPRDEGSSVRDGASSPDRDPALDADPDPDAGRSDGTLPLVDQDETTSCGCTTRGSRDTGPYWHVLILFAFAATRAKGR